MSIIQHGHEAVNNLFFGTGSLAEIDAGLADDARDEQYSPQCSKGGSNRCARAKGPKCRCQCGGHNHGNPKARENKQHSVNEHLGPGSSLSPLFDPYTREALRQTPDCRWCGHKLFGPAVGYPHDGGWIVPGFRSPGAHGGPEGRWWLFVVCEKCNYEWALWKLGVSRDWTPPAEVAA